MLLNAVAETDAHESPRPQSEESLDRVVSDTRRILPGVHKCREAVEAVARAMGKGPPHDARTEKQGSEMAAVRAGHEKHAEERGGHDNRRAQVGLLDDQDGNHA